MALLVQDGVNILEHLASILQFFHPLQRNGLQALVCCNTCSNKCSPRTAISSSQHVFPDSLHVGLRCDHTMNHAVEGGREAWGGGGKEDIMGHPVVHSSRCDSAYIGHLHRVGKIEGLSGLSTGNRMNCTKME